MIKTLNTLFVTMFGLGKLSKIPGTLGSLATILILYISFHIINLSTYLFKKFSLNSRIKSSLLYIKQSIIFINQSLLIFNTPMKAS